MSSAGRAKADAARVDRVKLFEFSRMQLIIWRRTAQARAIGVTMFLAGALSGMVPTGVVGDGAGLGLIAGAGWGLFGGLSVLPFLASIMSAAASCDNSESNLLAELVLSGISRRVQLCAHAIVSVAGCTLLLPVSAFGGSMTGLGDGLRQGHDLLGQVTFSWRLLIFASLAAIYLVTLASATASALRKRARTFLTYLGSLLVFFALAAATRRSTDWTWLAQTSPWAPMWAAVHRSQDELWIPLTFAQGVGVSSCWMFASFGLISRVTSRRHSL